MSKSCRSCAELDSLFDRIWAADMRGIKLWQAATGRTRTWPDGAKLICWLMERIDAAEKVIDVAREHAEIVVDVAAIGACDDARHEVLECAAAYDDKYPKPDVETED